MAMPCIVMGYAVIADIAMVYIVMAYIAIAMAYVSMACMVMPA